MAEAPEQAERPTRLLRWRLLLGEASAEELDTSLNREEQRMDAALAALYDAAAEEGIGSRRSGGLGSSAPRVARWLGDIRTYFPTSVVQIMQRDAIERLQLTSMLLEPELLDSIQPDRRRDRAADRQQDPRRRHRCSQPSKPDSSPPTT
jgi:hypothetical protein